MKEAVMTNNVVNLYIAFIIGAISMTLWMPKKKNIQTRNKEGVKKND